METNQLSPVVIIKQKELELAERWAKAKQAAERATLEARQWATEYRDRAEREGQEKAAVFRRAELEACDVQAEKVRTEGELSARWIAERGSRGMDQAVQRILEIILPTLPQPRASPTPSKARDPREAPEPHPSQVVFKEGGA
jgi:vacuolar-type H+-ATPase subunit H